MMKQEATNNASNKNISYPENEVRILFYEIDEVDLSKRKKIKLSIQRNL
jgi:hypothetical protein